MHLDCRKTFRATSWFGYSSLPFSFSKLFSIRPMRTDPRMPMTEIVRENNAQRLDRTTSRGTTQWLPG